MALACPHCKQPLAVPQPLPPTMQCPSCRAVIRFVPAKNAAPAAPPAQAPQAATGVRTASARMVAGYELQRELARGGLGTVFLAYHPNLKHYRAIKRPQPRTDFSSDELLARFRRETEALGALDSKHIIRAYDAGADAEGPYLVTEYLDGESLSSLAARHRQLPVAEACELVRQTALGLQAAHEAGMVHRDVKPSNLMLTRAAGGMARTVVIDWGLVKTAGDGDARSQRLTRMHSELGTPDYIAPEQVRDPHGVDIRADIYSLGATLYYLLAGRPPFQGQSDEQKQHSQTTSPFPPLEPLRPDVPAPVVNVLNRMVRKERNQRYATPAEVAAALQPFACAEPHRMLALLAPVPTQPQVRSDTARICDEKTQLAPSAPRVHGEPQPRRVKVWLAVGAGLAFLLATCILVPIVGFALFRDRKGDAPVARSDGDGKKKDKDESTKDAGPYALLPPPSDPVLDRAQDGKPLKMSLDRTNTWPATWVTFTPDGKRGMVRDRMAQFVRVFDLVDGVQSPKKQLQPAFDYENVPREVVVSPDGKRILVPSGKTVQRRNGETYEPEPPPFALFGDCTAVAFTPDSKVVATAERNGKGGTIRFWDAQNRAPLHKVIELDSRVIGLSFSPDGTFLAVSSGGLAEMNIVNAANERIRIYRSGEDKPAIVLPGHEKSACWAGFLADGKRLFSASPYDGTLRVWDIEKKTQITEITAGKSATGVKTIQDAKDPRYMVPAFAYWPWGRALTAYQDGSLKLWDLDTGKQIGERIDSLSDKPHTVPTAMAISPGGNFALLAYNDEHLYLLRLAPPTVGKRP